MSGKAVRDFRDRLLDRDVSIALVWKVLATLRLVAEHAIENDILATNPVEGVEVLDDSRIKEKIAVPSKAAVKAVGELKSAAGQRGVPAGPMVLNVLKKHRGDRIVRPDQLVFRTRRC